MPFSKALLVTWRMPEACCRRATSGLSCISRAPKRRQSSGFRKWSVTLFRIQCPSRDTYNASVGVDDQNDFSKANVSVGPCLATVSIDDGVTSLLVQLIFFFDGKIFLSAATLGTSGFGQLEHFVFHAN